MTPRQNESESSDLKIGLSDKANASVLVRLKLLQDRLEKDENAYLKIQAQANRQHAEALNQLADVCTLVQRLIARLEKQDARIKTLEGKK